MARTNTADSTTISNPSLTSANAVRTPVTFVQSPLFAVKTDPLSGVGVYASIAIPSGTLLFESLDPFLNVIYRPFKKEVCAWCFAYENGAKWKSTCQYTPSNGSKDPIGLAWFCSDDCRASWTASVGDLGMQAIADVSAAVAKSKSNAKASLDTSAALDSHKERNTEIDLSQRIDQAWQSAAGHAPRKPSLHEEDDEDTLFFLLNGIIRRHHDETAWHDRFLSLAPSLQPYRQKPYLIDSHVRMYHFLFAHIPEALRSACTPQTILALVSRDHGNSFGLMEPDGEMLGYAVWVECSFFNHACHHNVAKDNIKRKWSFWASEDIQPGQQLCINYLGDDVKEDRQWRRKKLSDGWDFVCQCSKCTGGIWS
ncbi:Histone-lysine N-methyltransferase set-6 [Cystobasidiomycetes sp. EMM_F5]